MSSWDYVSDIRKRFGGEVSTKSVDILGRENLMTLPNVCWEIRDFLVAELEMDLKLFNNYCRYQAFFLPGNGVENCSFVMERALIAADNMHHRRYDSDHPGLNLIPDADREFVWTVLWSRPNHENHGEHPTSKFLLERAKASKIDLSRLKVDFLPDGFSFSSS